MELIREMGDNWSCCFKFSLYTNMDLAWNNASTKRRELLHSIDIQLVEVAIGNNWIATNSVFHLHCEYQAILVTLMQCLYSNHKRAF